MKLEHLQLVPTTLVKAQACSGNGPDIAAPPPLGSRRQCALAGVPAAAVEEEAEPPPLTSGRHARNQGGAASDVSSPNRTSAAAPARGAAT